MLFPRTHVQAEKLMVDLRSCLCALQANAHAGACNLFFAADSRQGAMAEVRDLVGVTMDFVDSRRHRGRALTDAAKDSERGCLRFYAALVLRDLIQEVATLAKR